MHPEMIRAIAVQQMAQRQAEAQATRRGTLARQARKARRSGHGAPDPLAGVRIPDYIDATFEGRAGRGPAADGDGPAGARGSSPAVSRDAA